MNEIILTENINLISKIEISNKFNLFFIENRGIETNFISFNFDFGLSDTRRVLNHKIVDYPIGMAHLLEHVVGNHEINGVPAIDKFMAKKYIYLPYTTFYHTSFNIQNFGEIYEPVKDILELLYTFQTDEIKLKKEKKILLNESAYLYEKSAKIKYKNVYYQHPVRYELEGVDENLDEIDAKKLYSSYVNNYLNNKIVVIIMKNHISNSEISDIKELINNHEYIDIQNQRYTYIETKEVPTLSSIDNDTLLLAFSSIAVQNAHDRIVMKLIFDEVFEFILKLIDLKIDYEVEFGVDFSYLLISFPKTIYTYDFIHKIDEALTKIKEFKINDCNFALLQKKIISGIIRSLDDLIALNIDVVDAHFQEQNYFKIINEICDFSREDYKKILEKIDFDVKLKDFIKEGNMLNEKF